MTKALYILEMAMHESAIDAKSEKIELPPHPVICDGRDGSVESVDQRDTLDRVASIIALLQKLELSEGLSANAETGLCCILAMLESTVEHVSHTLAADSQ